MVWLFKQREFWAKSISRETEKLSTKASSMIQCSVVHIHSIRKTLCTHDILDWVVQIFTMQHKKNKVSANHLKAACMHQEASEGIYLQKGLFFVFDALKAFFFNDAVQNAVHSPGFCPAFSRSSSSKAASTADFAKAPARVIVGSSKSILKENENVKVLLLFWSILQSEDDFFFSFQAVLLNFFDLLVLKHSTVLCDF